VAKKPKKTPKADLTHEEPHFDGGAAFVCLTAERWRHHRRPEGQLTNFYVFLAVTLSLVISATTRVGFESRTAFCRAFGFTRWGMFRASPLLQCAGSRVALSRKEPRYG
jgi:hypothetical protein